MEGGLLGRELQEYTRLKTRDYVHQVQREFTEYLFDEAGQTVTVKRFDTDAVLEVVRELSHAGFVVEPDKDGYAPPQFVVHPADFHTFRDDQETYTRVTEPGPLRCYESEVHADPTLDEGCGIAIHPNAVTPGLPQDFTKPYWVRQSDGVIAIQMLTSA